ncbi:MAG: Rrf2 family transcriptional regulator [Acidobacteriota bacterium]
MACALRVSDASSMAMHAMALLALEPGTSLSTRAIASCFGISEAHLSKVLQRLTKVGLVRSVRGPKGGFSLARNPENITLMEVFTAIEGPVESSGCVFGVSRCDGTSCVLGSVMADANRMLLDHLARTDLRTVSAVFLDGRIKLPFDPPSRSAPLEAAGPD